MQLHLSPQALAERIQQSGKHYFESRQVLKRLSHLLPTRLKHLEREHRQGHAPGKALRLALTDPRYLAFVDELLNISEIATENRIQWETHRLLFEARRSLEAHKRAHHQAYGS